MVEKEVKISTDKLKAEKSKPSELLIENFVSLQKIMSDLVIKISRLNNQLSELLELFTEAARSFKETKKTEYKEGRITTKSTDDLGRKIDMLLDQNRDIAKNLSLIHQASMTREVSSTHTEDMEREGTKNVKAKPLPEFRF
jgi:hypothetical protein